MKNLSFGYLADFTQEINDVKSNLSTQLKTFDLIQSLFEKKRYHKKLMELYMILQIKFFIPKTPWLAILSSPTFKLLKREIRRQIRHLKRDRQKKEYDLIPFFIYNIFNSLNNMQKLIQNIEEKVKETKNIEDVKKEQFLERLFIQSFRILMICVRENIVFIYPYMFDGDYFPSFLVNYQIHDTIADIFHTYCYHFFSKRLLEQIYPQFEKSDIKLLITSQMMKGTDVQTFSNLGPIDMYLTMNQTQMKFFVKGTIGKVPFYPGKKLKAQVQLFNSLHKVSLL